MYLRLSSAGKQRELEREGVAAASEAAGGE